jgi:hypothetical protein
LIEEFKNRGKNNIFIDKRIGQTSSKLSEEDKMRLRYLREQKDQMKHSKISKKRTKFNLEDDLDSEEDQVYMGFTHGGRALEEFDDFKDDVPYSSDDDNHDRYNKDKKKG